MYCVAILNVFLAPTMPKFRRVIFFSDETKMLFNPKTTNEIHNHHHQKCTLFVFTVVCVNFSFSLLSSFRVREMSEYSDKR